jgi:hypothetical protein
MSRRWLSCAAAPHGVTFAARADGVSVRDLIGSAVRANL